MVSVITMSSMFLKVQLPWNVIIPADGLGAEGLMLQKAIVVRLLDDFACKKATKDLGYFIAVTTLESIGDGKVRQNTGDVPFPVVFSGITFKMFRGEILEGVVHKILKHGVFLRCGPVQNIYLSDLKMPDYHYVPGENAIFMNDKHSKIEKDVVVRFIAIGTKWLEAEREFQALVSLEETTNITFFSHAECVSQLCKEKWNYGTLFGYNNKDQKLN
ncbi:RNA polymerase Rpb7-like [Theobroma cacao]|nr:RNA polymerase Rpb7-like [Theobroma cacao]